MNIVELRIKAAIEGYRMGCPLWRCVRYFITGHTGKWDPSRTRRGREFWKREEPKS